jgi:hypothetical protein
MDKLSIFIQVLKAKRDQVSAEIARLEIAVSGGDDPSGF